MKSIDLKPMNFKATVLCILINVIKSIAFSQSIVIRILFKILFVCIVLALRLLFLFFTDNQSNFLKCLQEEPSEKSPSSSGVSRCIDTNKDNLKKRLKVSKLGFVNKSASLLNFVTPILRTDAIEFSEKDSGKHSDSLSLNSLDDTDEDCDSIDSCIINEDLKTHFESFDLTLNKECLQKDHIEKNKMNDPIHNGSGLPDLINQKGNKDAPTDKARKYLECLDGVKFNEIQVPDTLKKQLEYFDRDELLQLIAYQKKYLDFKETRIKDLENYIDNLVVKIIETEPLILMNASNVLNKSRNLI